MNLSIEVDEQNDDYLVTLNGEIDVYTAPNLKDKLLNYTEKEGKHIQVDLAGTTYLDSTGLGVFINAYKSSEAHGSQLELINANERIVRLFNVTGLNEIIHVSALDSSEEEAE